MPLTRPARIIVFKTYEVGPRGYVADDEAESQRGWGHFCGHGAIMCFGVQCCCPYTNLSNWVLCLLFIQAKPKRLLQGLGTFLWVPDPASLGPP